MKPIKHTVISFFSSCLILISSNITAQVSNVKVTPETYKTIYQMLRDVPGLDVKFDNSKNGGTVIVRGMGSLNNQKEPLFVLNGSIYSGDIGNINPQDVEDIVVLKDAASTTPYGAQGSYGVILINTKKDLTPSNKVIVKNYNNSAYSYFIEKKTPLKVIGLDDKVIIEGIIQSQRDSSLVFIKKKKEVLVQIRDIKKVEMIQNNN
jgi:TonB-dependent SusC/RagA subfamily outer membrane receptor